jgi:hypothetical protein
VIQDAINQTPEITIKTGAKIFQDLAMDKTMLMLSNDQELSHAAGDLRQPETRSKNCLSRHSFRAEAEPALDAMMG